MQLDPQELLALAFGREPTLLQVVEKIVEHPHREIVVDTPLVELEGLTEPETERFLELISDPGALSPAKQEPIHFHYDDRPYQFTRVFDSRPRVTHDTYPNRFVKHVLRRFTEALMDCGDHEAHALARRLNGMLATSIIVEVQSLHHITADHNVLRKDPNYREILRLDVELTHLRMKA